MVGPEVPLVAQVLPVPALHTPTLADIEADMGFMSTLLFPEVGEIPRMPRSNGHARLEGPYRPRPFMLLQDVPSGTSSVPPPIPRGGMPKQ